MPRTTKIAIERHRESMRRRYANLTSEEKVFLKALKLARRISYPEIQKGIRRRNHLKSSYGITPEQFDSLFVSQENSCAICKSIEPGSKKGWHIDHCHFSKKVRGILCHSCNLMIGQAKENEDRLISAVFYLLQHREKPCQP